MDDGSRDQQRMHPAGPPPLQLNTRTEYGDIIDSEFLRLLFAERLMIVRGSSWITRQPLDRLPGEVLASASYFSSGRDEALVRIDGTLVHAILSERALTVRVAAREAEAVEVAMNTLRQAVPEVRGEDQEVPVRFWWWQPGYAQDMARMLPAPGWSDISANYSDETKPQLKPLISWDGAPPGGGRLLLWHGDPGTGKTTAIRALAWEWREWAEFQFITDPEHFLKAPTYLLHVISESRRGSRAPRDRWRVLVLEDAGEYLAPDAKHLAGQALSRLLNVCDGALGQATRSLVLVTTNEPMHTLHPALSRPGRCLAQVEFTQLGRAEIERWCADRGLDAASATRSTLAELYAHAEGRCAIRRPAGFGFADAA